MQAPYIPTKDADFSDWLENFASLIAATPTAYGLIAGDATIISAANAAFQAAYTLAINPTTRTSPAIAEKDAQRTSADSTVRPYAIQISLNMGLTDAIKTGVGVNLPNNSRTPVPPPLTSPALELRSVNPGIASIGYSDVSTPSSKRKPFGAAGMQLVQTIGTAPAVSPDAGAFVTLMTKSPNSVTFIAGDVGKTVTLWGRWYTKSGPGGASQFGPWSTALSFAIV